VIGAVDEVTYPALFCLVLDRFDVEEVLPHLLALFAAFGCFSLWMSSKIRMIGFLASRWNRIGLDNSPPANHGIVSPAMLSECHQ
jgi:hypothetical protein